MQDHEIISWILYSVALASETQPAAQSDISQIADGINHANPTGAELKLAFSWLKERALVSELNGRYALTTAGATMLTEIRKGHTTAMGVWRALGQKVLELDGRLVVSVPGSDRSTRRHSTLTIDEDHTSMTLSSLPSYQWPAKERSKLVKEGYEWACAHVSPFLAALGFARTRRSFWTRVSEHTIEFVHFYRSGASYGAPTNAQVGIRVHFGIHVLNSAADGVVLNGPDSQNDINYHLRFNARSGSMFERCAGDLVRFVQEQGEPWFALFRNPESLLVRPDSPLQHANDRDALRDSLQGRASSARISASTKLFGIKLRSTQQSVPGGVPASRGRP